MDKTEEDESKSDSAEVGDIKAYYEEELDKYGPRHCSFEVVNVKSGLSIKERMMEYVNSNEPDLMALAPRAKEFLSSTTEYAIANVSCSVVLCKN